jgi:hypothetical protein
LGTFPPPILLPHPKPSFAPFPSSAPPYLNRTGCNRNRKQVLCGHYDHIN